MSVALMRRGARPLLIRPPRPPMASAPMSRAAARARACRALLMRRRACALRLICHTMMTRARDERTASRVPYSVYALPIDVASPRTRATHERTAFMPRDRLYAATFDAASAPPLASPCRARRATFDAASVKRGVSEEAAPRVRAGRGSGVA